MEADLNDNSENIAIAAESETLQSTPLQPQSSPKIHRSTNNTTEGEGTQETTTAAAGTITTPFLGDVDETSRASSGVAFAEMASEVQKESSMENSPLDLVIDTSESALERELEKEFEQCEEDKDLNGQHTNNMAAETSTNEADAIIPNDKELPSPEQTDLDGPAREEEDTNIQQTLISNPQAEETAASNDGSDKEKLLVADEESKVGSTEDNLFEEKLTDNNAEKSKPLNEVDDTKIATDSGEAPQQQVVEESDPAAKVETTPVITENSNEGYFDHEEDETESTEEKRADLSEEEMEINFTHSDETNPSIVPIKSVLSDLTTETADNLDAKFEQLTSKMDELRESNGVLSPASKQSPQGSKSLPRVATIQKNPAPKESTVNSQEAKPSKKLSGLPRVATIQKQSKPISTEESKSIEALPAKKLSGLPRVATLTKANVSVTVPDTSSVQSGSPSKKLVGLPRVATLPVHKPVQHANPVSENTSPSKKIAGLPRVATLPVPVKPKKVEPVVVEPRPVKKISGLPRVATLPAPRRTEIIEEAPKLTPTKIISGLPRVAHLAPQRRDVSDAGSVASGSTTGKKLIGLPRVAKLPAKPRTPPAQVEWTQKPASKKITGLPRVAHMKKPLYVDTNVPKKEEAPKFQALPMPEYPPPKEPAPLIPIRPTRKSPSKEERDLQECKNQFKALPRRILDDTADVHHVDPKPPTTPEPFHFRIAERPVLDKVPSTEETELEECAKKFKFHPVPAFDDANAEFPHVDPKPPTTPEPFNFKTGTEERLQRECCKAVQAVQEPSSISTIEACSEQELKCCNIALSTVSSSGIAKAVHDFLNPTDAGIQPLPPHSQSVKAVVEDCKVEDKGGHAPVDSDVKIVPNVPMDKEDELLDDLLAPEEPIQSGNLSDESLRPGNDEVVVTSADKPIHPTNFPGNAVEPLNNEVDVTKTEEPIHSGNLSGETREPVNNDIVVTSTEEPIHSGNLSGESLEHVNEELAATSKEEPIHSAEMSCECIKAQNEDIVVTSTENVSSFAFKPDQSGPQNLVAEDPGISIDGTTPLTEKSVDEKQTSSVTDLAPGTNEALKHENDLSTSSFAKAVPNLTGTVEGSQPLSEDNDVSTKVNLDISDSTELKASNGTSPNEAADSQELEVQGPQQQSAIENSPNHISSDDPSKKGKVDLCLSPMPGKESLMDLCPLVKTPKLSRVKL